VGKETIKKKKHDCQDIFGLHLDYLATHGV